MKSPIPNKMKNLFRKKASIWALPSPLPFRRAMENTEETPTTKRKKGNIRPVQVHWFHSPCLSWE